jgi:hypothetical protein
MRVRTLHLYRFDIRYARPHDIYVLHMIKHTRPLNLYVDVVIIIYRHVEIRHVRPPKLYVLDGFRRFIKVDSPLDA